MAVFLNKMADLLTIETNRKNEGSGLNSLYSCEACTFVHKINFSFLQKNQLFHSCYVSNSQLIFVVDYFSFGKP